MAQICVNVPTDFGSFENAAKAIRAAGFDGIFHDWSDHETAVEFARAVEKEGLFLQSIHAPFGKMNNVWYENDPTGDETVKTLIGCVDDCALLGAPILVCHAFIGFNEHSPNEIGLKRLEPLFEHAEKKGIRLAFENTEGEEYLAAIMKHFSKSSALGFCFDSGHELCYNERRDVLALYGGNTLCATHLNDNFGVTGDEITWLDDSHVLPFDGTADWQGIAERFKKHSFNGPFTLELTRQNKPSRNTHDRYANLTNEKFMEEAYNRALRFVDLMK